MAHYCKAAGVLTLAALSLALHPPSQKPPEARLTFAGDIAPIIFDKCAACHRPGGPAPFSVLTYADVRPRAAQIASAVSARVMPPWKPEPGYGEFVDERRLTQGEIAAIVRWVEQGAPEGSGASPPPAPPAGDTWTLGKPDLILTMPEPYALPATGPDVFRMFVLPVPIPEHRYVRAVEFRPGNARIVHHATMKLDTSGTSRQLDEQSADAGYGGLTPLSAAAPDGHFLGWTPGQRPYMSGEHMPWRLEQGTDFVLEMHLKPSGRRETLQSSVGLYFSAIPPTQTPVALRLGRQDIDIPAGERSYTISDSYTLPVDVRVYSVYPHAHNLARTIKAAALLPDGATDRLLYIEDWDFNWQDLYRYAKPRVLPKGTVLSVTLTYDNSSGNARNPHRPPKRVFFGKNSSDEMGDLWLQLVPQNEADLAVLKRDVLRKLLVGDIAGIETMLRADPGNRSLHDQAALLYETAGRRDRAAWHFTESLRIESDAAAFNNLGYVHLKQGKLDDARAMLLKALELNPNYARAHHNLGLASMQAGRLEEAANHYRESIRIDSDDADSRYMLGMALVAQRRVAEALPHYRRAIELRPDWLTPLVDLAYILAASPDPDIRRPGEALTLAQRAVQLTTPPSAAALSMVAASLAALGEFDRATATATTALNAAAGAGNEHVAEEIRRQLDLYRQHKPLLAR